MASSCCSPPIKSEPLTSPEHASKECPVNSDAFIVQEDDFSSLFDDDLGADADHEFYQEAIECLPKTVAFDDEFPQVHKRIITILDNAIAAIPPDSRDAPCFRHHLAKAGEYKQIPRTRRSRINIVGKSGAGKSSLLNSLLGRPEATKALAASRGCTHVPTAFEYPFACQIKAYAVKIEFFEIQEIRKMIDMLLKDYYGFYFEDTSDFDKLEIVKLENAANTALETFRLLFCNKSNFATEEAGKLFLSQSYKTDLAQVADKLVHWCKDLIHNELETIKHLSGGMTGQDSDECKAVPQSCDTAVVPNLFVETANFFQADDQQSIVDYVETYGYSDSTYERPSFWPIIKLIRQGLRGVEILNYATLTDWPGADDTNHLRANASAQRVYDCDEIWIVSSADRIATDPTATANLSRYGRDVRCVLICTCIDDKLDEGLAKEIAKSGFDIGNHEELLSQERAVTRALPHLRKIKAKLDAVVQNSWESASMEKRRKLNPELINKRRAQQVEVDRELRDQEELLRDTRQKRFDLLVNIRKSYIESLLMRELSHHIPDSQLMVFFASNSHYAALKGSGRIDGPLMSPQATGIPQLRQYILETAAPETVRALKNLIHHHMTVFLGGVQHVANPGSLEGCEAALKKVLQRQERLRPLSAGYLHELGQVVTELLIEPLNGQQATLIANALKVLGRKRSWSLQTIKAFVRRDGCHATQAQEYHSWNEQFLETARDAITALWPDFHSRAECLSNSLQKTLVQLCRDVVRELDGDASMFRLQEDSFASFIDGAVKGIDGLLETYQTEFSKSLTRVKIEATWADEQNADGYFNVAMQEVWDRAKGISGKGAKARILERFATHLELGGHRSPFFVVTKRLGEEILNAAQEHQEIMVKGIEAILKDMHQWLQDMFQVDTGDETEMEVRAALQEYHVKAAEDFVHVKELLASVESKYQETKTA